MLLTNAIVIEFNALPERLQLYVVTHKVIETIGDGTSRARTVNVNLHVRD